MIILLWRPSYIHYVVGTETLFTEPSFIALELCIGDKHE